MAQLQIPAVATFDPHGEPTSVAQRWDKWKKAFEYFVIASGITDDNRKTALLLHLGGAEIQEIFETLTVAENTYEHALTALNDHFKVKKNIPFERSKFLQANQESNESIEQFVTRLRKLSLYCEYTDNTEQIRDRVVVACSSTKLRKRLLGEPALTLDKAIEIARTQESAIHQTKEIENGTAPSSEPHTDNVNHIKRRSDYKPKNSNFKSQGNRDRERRKSCTRCGATGHTGPECRRSRGKTCSKCGKEGHFATVCFTKPQTTIDNPQKYRMGKKDKSRHKQHHVRQVLEEFNDSDSDSGEDEHVYLSHCQTIKIREI